MADEANEDQFQYSLKQRNEITEALAIPEIPERESFNIEELIDGIEIVVGETSKLISNIRPWPDERQRKEWRKLKNHIDPILKLLEDDAFQSIREILPELAQNFYVLDGMIKADQTKGRGSPGIPNSKMMMKLVELLLDQWMRVHTEMPHRSHDPYKVKDDGAFHKFVHACVNPIGLDASDKSIRRVLETSLKY